jgi:RHS repeat-associated protein
MINSRYPTSRSRASLVATIVSLSLLIYLVSPFLFFPIKVEAQGQTITFDSAGSQRTFYSGATTSPTLTWAHSIGSGANRILIVSVSTSAATPIPNDRVTGVTYGSTGLSRIGTVMATDQHSAVEMFELLAPPAGAHNIVVSFIPLAQTYAVGGSISFSRVNQTTPLRMQHSGSMATNTGTFESPNYGPGSVANVSVISGNSDVVIDTVATNSSVGSFTPISPQTLQWAGAFLTSGITIGGATRFDIGAGSTRSGAAPTASMTWSMPGRPGETGGVAMAPWAIGAISLIPAAAPAQSTPTPNPLPTPPTVHPPGLPPGRNLPNLDLVRKLQSLTPVVRPGGPMTAAAPICDVGSDCGGCPDCGPPEPNDPNYSTPRTQPQNKTGQPGITLGSRNYNWSAPLVSLTGRSGMDLNLALTYNSLVWVYDNGQIKFNPDDGFPGPGFRLGFPVVQQRFQNSDTGIWSYMMITPSGGRMELRQVGSSNAYQAYDGSYTQLTDNGAGSLVVLNGDGTQFSFTDAGNGYVCTAIEDRNGNFINVSYNGNLPVSVTDSLGRVIAFNYMNGFLSSITQNWDGQTHTWATFNYNSIFFTYNFPGLQVSAPPNNSLLAVPTQVNLDDGSSYQFTYNTWGQIYQISHVAPDGHTLAYTSYNLPTDATTAQSDCPRFTERHEFAQDWNGGNEAVTQLGVDSDGGQVMITPDGTRYKELDYFSGWQNGLPMLEEWWSGGVRQKWTNFSWIQDNTNAFYSINPRLVDTTVSDVTGNQRRSSIAYSSFTMPSGESCSLPSEVTEYAADAVTPLRRTHTDYNLDPAFLSRNIIGLVSSRSVFDGGGTLFSRTDVHYDESGLQDPGAISQHDGNYGAGFVQGRGNQTSITRFDVTNLSQSRTASVAYNTAGSAVSATDPVGHSTAIDYSDSNGGNSFAYPTRATDADGNATIAQYDYDMGVLTQVETPPPVGFTQGPVETRQYDAARRPLQVTNNVNGAHNRWVYDSTQTIVQQFATIQDGAGETYSAQILDGAGRVRATAQDHPTGSSGSYRGQYVVFDNMGRMAQQSNTDEMNSQWLAAGDDAAAGWIYTLQAYDWKGRPTVTTNTDNTQRVNSYGNCGCAGGQVVTVQDEAGRQRRTTSDALGRPARVDELNWDGSVYATTTYAYNTLDHLTNINQSGLSRSFAYDGYGRLQTRTTPEQGATSYAYFADDDVQTVTDARGATTNFTYNGRHSVTGISYGVPAGVTATANASFAYDAAGNRISMTDGTGSCSYGYDQLSRMTSETHAFNGVGSFPISYSYNLGGELTGITNPWGAQVSYNYYVDGELASVGGAGYAGVSNYASGVTYRAFGSTKGVSYGNGLSLSAGYDGRMRPLTWNVSNVLGYNYAYDYYNEHTGRVTYAQSIYDSTLDRSYQYDHVGRLVISHSGAEARASAFSGQWGTMDGPYSQGYDFDVWGNMTHRYGWGGEVQGGGAGQTSEVFYSYTNNRRDGFSYDAAGNLTNDLGQNFTYDATGQQTLASYGGYSLQQSYDGNGLRVAKTENGSTTWYLRSTVLGGQVVAETDASGNWMRGYVYAGENLLAVQEGGVYWMHQDPVTKSLRATDNLGNVTSAIELDPWGADTNRSWNAAFQPHKFTSYERDGNGSDEAMFRRYNRWHSRFDQPDPSDGSYNFSNPQSLNRYAYVQNDPVSFVDPTGLDEPPPDCGPGTEARKDDKGDWQCVGTGTSTVTVTGSWDDMSDYLPDWTSDNNFALVITLMGDPVGGGGLAPLNPKGPTACEAMAINAQNAANKALRDAHNDPNKALRAFDDAFSKLYIGHAMRTYAQAVDLYQHSPHNSSRYTGQTGFRDEFLDSENGKIDRSPDTDQTHHFAAYFSGGINGQYTATTAHAWEDYYKHNNKGDYNLGNASYGIGAQLRSDPSLLNNIGNMIRKTICKT